jgi:hypothetical protein
VLEHVRQIIHQIGHSVSGSRSMTTYTVVASLSCCSQELSVIPERRSVCLGAHTSNLLIRRQDHSLRKHRPSCEFLEGTAASVLGAVCPLARNFGCAGHDAYCPSTPYSTRN